MKPIYKISFKILTKSTFRETIFAGKNVSNPEFWVNNILSGIDDDMHVH